MFKASVIAFAILVSGFMIWVGNHDANFASLPMRSWPSGLSDGFPVGRARADSTDTLLGAALTPANEAPQAGKMRCCVP